MPGHQTILLSDEESRSEATIKVDRFVAVLSDFDTLGSSADSERAKTQNHLQPRRHPLREG